MWEGAAGYFELTQATAWQFVFNATFYTFLGTPGATLCLNGQGKSPGNAALRAETASVPGDSAHTTVKRHDKGGCRSTMELFLLWEPLSPLPMLLFSLDHTRVG